MATMKKSKEKKQNLSRQEEAPQRSLQRSDLAVALLSSMKEGKLPQETLLKGVTALLFGILDNTYSSDLIYLARIGSNKYAKDFDLTEEDFSKIVDA